MKTSPTAKFCVLCILGLTLQSAPSMAQTQPDAITGSPSTSSEASKNASLSFNLGAVTDYRYRGISQTGFKPTLQGGADFIDADNSWYFGTWLSGITWIRDTPNAGRTPIEWDLYLGKKTEIAEGYVLDLGLLEYVYAQNHLNQIGLNNANTLELYTQLSYGGSSLKLSHSLSSLFGIVDSKSSQYLDFTQSFELAPSWTLSLHAGRQWVSGQNRHLATYNDYKLGISKDFGKGLSLGLAAVGTNAKSQFYASPQNGKNLGRSSLVLNLQQNF